MPRKMSDEHKEALAKGRAQSRAVRTYLEALDRDSRPGRRLSRDDIEARIQKIQAQIDQEDNPAKRVDLIQRRLDLEQQLVGLDDTPDLESLEEEFVQAAQEYSERKGISYTAWREAGVPASVLRRAGVPRTRKTS